MVTRLLGVPTLPGQDLPDLLRHDHEGPAPTGLEELMRPFRDAGALLAERTRRRWWAGAGAGSVRIRTDGGVR